MEEVLSFISDVGLPIAGAVLMGFFIFLVMKQIFEGLVDDIKTLTMFCNSLD